MKKLTIICMAVVLLLGFSGSAFSSVIPASERAALIALYNSTNGDSWIDNSGWKTPPLESDGFGEDERSWYGVWVVNDVVTDLSLMGNQLTGTIPSEIGNLINLDWLNLGHNQLTGSLNEIWTLTKLKGVYLSDNQLTGSIPPEIGNLTNLDYLSLGVNQLTGSIPPEIGDLNNLSSFHIDHNQLTGSIPPEIGNLTNLEDLELDDNQLTGSIPPEIWTLVNLKELELGENQLTGSIPPEIGNLTNLEDDLYLGDNQLTGSIPPEIGNLTNLKNLYLGNSQLTGSIPVEIGNLINLLKLELYDNQLTGPIPSTIKNLTNLEDDESDFTYNCLYTDDDTVRDFLNQKQEGGDWESYQNACDPCLGDCDENGVISISEIQSAINQYLGTNSVEPCNDENGDGTISISEIQTIVNSYLQGCN